MQILSVTLKNFKTHQDRHFAFQPGTNAICGENGAGKTSILEAIAWSLFNYQGSYAKEDLIRNGSGSAQVTVEFVSSHDQRTYAVQRCTTKGYTLFDPQLGQRLPYNRIKDEVLPWLRDHLGVSPGTDLGELFARTIGVPQGTFTADFLQAPEARKAVFDKILKVDEYKTVHRDLNGLRRYAEAQVEDLERTITNYDEQLLAQPNLAERHQALGEEISRNEAELHRLTAQLTTLEQERVQLTTQAQQVQVLTTTAQALSTQVAAQRQNLVRLEAALATANQAVSCCQANQAAYQAYEAADGQLLNLNQQQIQRQQLQGQQQQLQKTLATRTADLARIQVKLDTLTANAQELDKLQPQIQQQQTLQQELDALQQQQQHLAQAQGALQAMQQQRNQLEHNGQEAAEAIAQLEALRPQVAIRSDLERQRDRLQQQLSRLEAARQFEQELQQLVTRGQDTCQDYQADAKQALAALEALEQSLPLLSAPVIATLKTTVASGVTLNQGLLNQVEAILTDLSTQVNRAQLEASLQDLQSQLQACDRHQMALAALPQWHQQWQTYQTEAETLAQRQADLQQQLQAQPALAEQIAATRTTLAALNDPQAQWNRLTQAQAAAPTLQQNYSQLQKTTAHLEAQLHQLATEIDGFADLDQAIATQQQAKQTHQQGYQQYLQHQTASQAQPQIAAQVLTAQTALAHLEDQANQAQVTLQTALQQYDADHLAELNTRYEALRSQRDRLTGTLPEQKQRHQDLSQQLEALAAIAEKRDRATAERKHRERIKRFINFARKAYKEAGPRITERYVQQISREADQLFRELLNRPNLALTWTKDYDIQVQEGPHQRRFINLSGGEQMCAALAVRLALLKVLANLDIAFFDEPTTNMDRPRRESLAEAIARLRSFQQLFVISHDDTFEKVTENVILVERQP
jgi:exonuclease SbcC